MTTDTLLASEARGHAATGWARQLRRHARITQAELAHEVGVARSTIAMWETGQRNPRGRKAAAYGRALRALNRRRLPGARSVIPPVKTLEIGAGLDAHRFGFLLMLQAPERKQHPGVRVLY